MNIETLRTFCLALPSTTEDIKWGNDLCFSVGKKMYCISGLNGPFSACIKVREEEFEELCTRPGILAAPYLARYKWVLIENREILSTVEWERYVRQSYELIKAGLSKKTRQEIEGSDK